MMSTLSNYTKCNTDELIHKNVAFCYSRFRCWHGDHNISGLHHRNLPSRDLYYKPLLAVTISTNNYDVTCEMNFKLAIVCLFLNYFCSFQTL